MRSVILSSSLPQTVLPTVEHLEQPASPVNVFPDLQVLGGDDGESTPQALGLLIGTQVRPVENCVHLRSVILSSSLPQTILPTVEHWEQPAWPVNDFPEAHWVLLLLKYHC